jgi:serine/threonine protein kinase
VSNLHSGVDEPAVTEIRGVLPKGASLRNYEVLSVLGQGAFGITYLARDVTLDREVAIKEYLPTALALREEGNTVAARSTNTAPDFVTGRDRFLDEARTLAKLDRVPSVVRVLDFLAANGTAYMVMALVEGETLETRIGRLGKLDSDAVKKLLWSLIDGLEQVHASGYLHRDIKPANILLDVQGNPTLIDFGAARAALAGSSVAMTAIFTPGYAAPEQFTSAKQGPWTDIYGVAATLYHAIAGHPPPSAFERLLDDEYEPLTRLLPAAFSPGMLVGIDAGLSVRAAERPQSIAGWRTIISQAASAGDAAATVALGRRPDRTTTTAISHAATTAPDLAPVPVKAAKRGAGLWAGAAAVVLVLAGGGYYVATSSLLGPPRAPLPVVTAAATETSKAQDAEAQQKADAGQALRREIAEETRRQIEAERAEQRRLDEEVRQKTEAAKESADAEAEAKRKLEADDKVAAEANENALHLSPLDRRHIQVALTGLGFDTAGTRRLDPPYARNDRQLAEGAELRRDRLPCGCTEPGAAARGRACRRQIRRRPEKIRGRKEKSRRCRQGVACARASGSGPSSNRCGAQCRVSRAEIGARWRVARHHALHALEIRTGDFRLSAYCRVRRLRHVGSPRLGPRNDGQSVHQFDDRRLACRRDARLRAEQPARRDGKGDDVGPVRRQHDRRCRPGGERRRPHMRHPPDAGALELPRI